MQPGFPMQHRLIELFGGARGIRDKGAVEAAVFRPQTGSTIPSKKSGRASPPLNDAPDPCHFGNPQVMM